MTNNQTPEMPETLYTGPRSSRGYYIASPHRIEPDDTAYFRASEPEALRAENERLKSLAYHKEGISYQAMFTAVIGMGEDADNWKEIADQLAGALEKCHDAAANKPVGQVITVVLHASETALAAYRDMKGGGDGVSSKTMQRS